MAEVRPIALAPDNFTPLARTPWAGDRILRRFKQRLIDEARWPAQGRVGESWEFSAGAEFPSHCATTGRILAEVFAEAPALMLGAEAESGGSSLLVKLLDSADLLSVQIHPEDDYPALEADESGKPECWYILEHDEGAGIFLGLEPGIDRRAMEEAMVGDRDFRDCLHFIEVRAGDFFVVEAGTPHAIGAGVLLLEPQQVRPGRRGVTYRYWDWARRYDADGLPSPAGEPRALHEAHALAVTDWNAPMDEARLRRSMLRAGAVDRGAPATLLPLCGESGLASAHLRAARLSGTGPLALPGWNAACALTILEGRARMADDASSPWWEMGQTLAIPSAIARAELELDHAHAVLSSTRSPRAEA